MHRSIQSVLTVILATTAIASAQADKVYDIIPYDGFSAGWSLDGGSITTDGTIGSITDANFVDYMLSITSPAGSFTLDPNNSDTFFTNVGTVTTMIATEQDIILPAASDPNTSAALLFTTFNIAQGAIFYGGFNGQPGSIFLNDDPIFDEIQPAAFVQAFSIARVTAVPEPNTVWMVTAWFGASTLIRRRRSMKKIKGLGN